MTGPAAVVFDFDGVLADSEPLHFRVFRRVLAEAGVELTERAYYERYLGFEDEGAFEAVSRDHVRTWTADDIARLIARKAELMPALLAGDGVLFPGAADCVRACAARAPLAIASGAQRGEIELVLRAARLDFLFQVVVASGDTRKGKPDTAPYVKAVELLKRATRLPMPPPRSTTGRGPPRRAPATRATASMIAA